MTHAVRTALVAAALATAGGCARQDQQLQLHREAFQSLGATVEAIGHAWLDGDVSGTYTDTALAQTQRLVEQERTALAAAPETLIDPRGAELSQAAERLSRLIAVLIRDVRAADAPSARTHLAQIPIKPERTDRP